MSQAWDERVERLSRRLATFEPGPGLRLRLPGGERPRSSAVLLPLLPPATLVYTERGAQLSAHAGQVSFPGGKPEDADATLLDAALREAREEIGLRADSFELLGELTPVPTPTGFLIHPFVVRLKAGESLPDPRPQSGEVASVVLASLELLERPGVHSMRKRPWQGLELISHEYELPALELASGRTQPPTRIWGATGRITRQLLELAGDDS